MKIMILGAAGQISRLVTEDLLKQSDVDLVLYGRNVTNRLANQKSDRVTLVDGTFEDIEVLKQSLKGVDAVFIGYVAGPEIIKPIVQALEEANIKRFIVMSIPDIYQEVSGPFQEWYRKNTGLVWQGELPKSAAIVENSSLDYVLLRVTWLYNQAGNTTVEVTHKGEPFESAQITREAVSQFVTDLLTEKVDYHRESLGLGEPNTKWTKPSFY